MRSVLRISLAFSLPILMERDRMELRLVFCEVVWVVLVGWWKG